MAPTLFSMMFFAMLTDAFQDVGFPIRYRFDGKLLNLRILQANTNVQTDVVDKLLYADDLAEKPKSEEKMQGAVDCMSKARDKNDRGSTPASQHLESPVQRTNHHCEWTKTTSC